MGSTVVKEVGRGCNQGEQRSFGCTSWFQDRMLQLVHDQLGHVGTGKMFWALKRQCTWPGMSGTV